MTKKLINVMVPAGSVLKLYNDVQDLEILFSSVLGSAHGNNLCRFTCQNIKVTISGNFIVEEIQIDDKILNHD